MKNFPTDVKHCVNALEIQKIFSATVIASVENTLKKIYLIDDFLLNLNPNYFKRKNFIFRISSDITWRITLEILNILN